MNEKKEKLKLNLYDYYVMGFFCCLYVLGCAIDNMQKILTIALFAVTFLALCVFGKKVRIKFISTKDCSFWYFLFAIYASLTKLWSFAGAAKVVNIFTAVIQIVVFLVCIDWYVRSKEELRKLIYFFCISTFVFGLAVLLTSPPSTYGQLEFGEATGMQRNTTGYLLMFGCLFDLYIAKNEKNKKYYFFALVCMVVSLLTGSRKIIVGYVLALMLWILLQKNIVKVIRYGFVILVGCLIVIPILYKIPFMQEVFGSRLMALFDDNIHDGSVLARQDAKNIAAQLFKSKPLIGNGWNSVYITYALTYYWEDHSIYAHNNYLEICADFGLIGIVLFYWKFIISAVKSLLMARKSDASRFVAICLIVVMVLDYGQVTCWYIYMISVFAIIFKMYEFADRGEI